MSEHHDEDQHAHDAAAEELARATACVDDMDPDHPDTPRFRAFAQRAREVLALYQAGNPAAPLAARALLDQQEAFSLQRLGRRPDDSNPEGADPR